MPRLRAAPRLPPTDTSSPTDTPPPTDTHAIVRQQLTELAMEVAIKRRHLDALQRSKESVREKECLLQSHTVWWPSRPFRRPC
jgi:hypothetical protein